MTANLADAAACYAARDYRGAEAICRRLIAAAARDFDALHLLGVVLTIQDRATEAIPFLRAAEAERPADARLAVNLGTALLAAKQFEAAIGVSGGDDPAALNNLGLAYRGLGQHESAERAFDAATKAAWDYAPAWFNRATALAALGRLEEALRAGRTAMRVAAADTPVSRLADISNTIGRIFLELGQPAQALAECRSFLHRFPGERSVIWNMALCLLLLGRFEEGWLAYEARWGLPGHDPHPDGAVVVDPAAVSGLRVALLMEQGRGDMIQFVRYANTLRAAGARVVVQAYPDLVDLLATMPAIDAVVSTDDPRPAADVYTAVMSLPLAFGGIPAAIPYLSVPRGRGRTLPARQGTRVGLAWSGSAESHARAAMAIGALAPLLALEGFEFHCLQKFIRDDDRLWMAENAAPIAVHEVGDFGDTAALISQMDVVISVDTAVAHLAGALGRRVFVVLPFKPDWRWLLGRDDSPWYPTARLFRQPERGSWGPVVEAVSRALCGLSRGDPPA